MNRRILSSVFLLGALIILSLPHFNVTGDVISEISQGQNIIYAISLAFFLISVFLFLVKPSLDAIVIPTGDPIQKKRVKKAYEEGKENPNQIYLITGRIDQPIKKSEVYGIYEELRKHYIETSKIRIEGKSVNTLENVLNSFEKLKKMGAREVGMVSYPRHLDRFEYIIKKAKKEGIIDKDFKVHRIETSQTLKEDIYGILAYLLEMYNLRHGFKGYKRDRDSFIEKTWDWFKNILNPAE